MLNLPLPKRGRGRPSNKDAAERLRLQKRRVLDVLDLDPSSCCSSDSEDSDEDYRRTTRSQGMNVDYSSGITHKTQAARLMWEMSDFRPAKVTKTEIDKLASQIIPRKKLRNNHFNGSNSKKDADVNCIWGRNQAKEGFNGNMDKRRKPKKRKFVAEELYSVKKGRVINEALQRNELKNYAESLTQWAESGFPQRGIRRGRKDLRRDKGSLEGCVELPGSVVLVLNDSDCSSERWFPALLISRSYGGSQIKQKGEYSAVITQEDSQSRSRTGRFSSLEPVLSPTAGNSNGLPQSVENSFLKDPGSHVIRIAADRADSMCLVRSFEDNEYHEVSLSRLCKFDAEMNGYSACETVGNRDCQELHYLLNMGNFPSAGKMCADLTALRVQLAVKYLFPEATRG